MSERVYSRFGDRRIHLSHGAVGSDGAKVEEGFVMSPSTSVAMLLSSWCKIFQVPEQEACLEYRGQLLTRGMVLGDVIGDGDMTDIRMNVVPMLPDVSPHKELNVSPLSSSEADGAGAGDALSKKDGFSTPEKIKRPFVEELARADFTRPDSVPVASVPSHALDFLEPVTQMRDFANVEPETLAGPPCFCTPVTPSLQHTVVKAGPNQGRKFYSCVKPLCYPSRCVFFRWLDVQSPNCRCDLPASYWTVKKNVQIVVAVSSDVQSTCRTNRAVLSLHGKLLMPRLMDRGDLYLIRSRM